MLNKPVILVNPPPLWTLETSGMLALEKAGYSLWRNETGVTLDREELLRRIPQAVAAIGGLEPYDAGVLAAAPDLKAIARFGVGFDNVDLDAAKSAGIEVTISPGANTQSVADVVLALMTNLCCGILSNHATVVAGSWQKTKFPGLFGRTLGIIGFGRIGQAVAQRAQAFGMTVISYDPYNNEVPTASTFEEIITKADVVTLHVPATDKPILDANALAQMKQGAMVINAARGGLIDEDALAKLLETGHLGGAGLDVFKTEPLPESPLRQAPNVILTPHIAGVSSSATVMMADMCADSILCLARGSALPEDRIIVGRPSVV
ncbi:MAG: phosphoglycerate dehydrogenase [Rhodobacteraceae bacterium]|nr:phosphoglycerate dehydrogenase [Paracoccaceae bacterium]